MRLAIASYYALVSFLDDNVGKVLGALEAAGLTEYDARHLHLGPWRKPRLPRALGKIGDVRGVGGDPLHRRRAGHCAGKVVDTPISLVDCYRSVLEAVGCPAPAEDAALPSRSIWAIAEGERPQRCVLSEYHAAASVTGTFMIRHGRWKYIHHVGFRPELFDLEADPGETTDLAEQPGMAPVLAECEAQLRAICDPDAVNAQAFADQRRLIEFLWRAGGHHRTRRLQLHPGAAARSPCWSSRREARCAVIGADAGEAWPVTITVEDVGVQGAEGVIPVRVFTPETPRGGLIVYMDALGMRPELDEMCRDWAGQGYTTFLPDLFWRRGRLSFSVPGRSAWPARSRHGGGERRHQHGHDGRRHPRRAGPVRRRGTGPAGPLRDGRLLHGRAPRAGRSGGMA